MPIVAVPPETRDRITTHIASQTKPGGAPTYSPKVDERLIPELWKLGQIRRRPMTKLVAEAVEHYLAEQRALLELSDGNSIPSPETNQLERAA